MKKIGINSFCTRALAVACLVSSVAQAAGFNPNCKQLPNYKTFKEALIKSRNETNGGLNLDMWGSLINRDGNICAVAFTGKNRGDQWPGSRVISAQKANTANAFSLPGFALSTANLYSAVQPGNSLFGLQESNPVNTTVAYGGEATNFGQLNDPMVGKRVGGVNVFGGGVALYNAKGELVGALGVSGDTSCADHNIAWRLRKHLDLDYVPAGVGPTNDDNIIYLAEKETPAGFKHPSCGNKENTIELPAVARIAEAK